MRNIIILSNFIGLLTLAVLTQANKQVESVVGEEVTLTCSLARSDPPKLRWVDWIHNKNRDPQPIFNSVSNPNRDIDASHPNGDRMTVGEDLSLVIRDLKFGDSGDSGEYVCISVQDDGTELEETMQLNIAGTPECSGDGDLVKGDTSVFSCVVPFSGATMPTLGWYMDGEKLDNDDMSDIGVAKQHFNMNPANEMYDGKVLTCMMAIGDLKEECSISVTVKYLVSDVAILPSTEEIAVGAEVKCTANGNPRSKVKMVFSGMEISETVEGDEFVSFVVPKSWEGKEVSAKCEGSNELNGQIELLNNEVTYKVEGPPTTTISSTLKPEPETEPVTENSETPKPKQTQNIAEPTPNPGAGTGNEEDPGNGDDEEPASGGGNIIGIVAGVIIAALVIVVIVIAVACILRKSSKKHKGAKPVPTKEEDVKRMEDGRGVWNSSLAYSEGEKHGRYKQTHPFPPPSNGAIPIDGVFYHKDGSGEHSEDGVDVGLVGSVDLDNNKASDDTNLDTLDTSHLNFTDVDYSQILHPKNSHTDSS